MDLFSKMSPYCLLHVGSENFKTKVQKKVGVSPVFNQNFIFNLDGKTEPVMHILVMDEGLVSDDTIGRVDIQLTDLCKTVAEQRFQVVDKNNFKKMAGDLILQCVSYSGTVLPNQPPKAAAPAPAPAAMAAAPQIVYVQQPMQQPMQQPRVVYVQQPQVIYAAQPQQVVYMQAPPRQL